MPATAVNPNSLDFFSLTAPEFDERAVGWGWPRFRGRQVRDWVYKKAIADPSAMTNLSRPQQEFLSQHVTFATSAVASRQTSSDGTQKLLLAWDNGANAETVLIP